MTGLDDIWATLAHSSYHALQVKFRKRYSNGVQFLFSYTFSKTIDDISAVAAYGNQAPGLHRFLQPAAGQIDFGGGPDARPDVQLSMGAACWKRQAIPEPRRCGAIRGRRMGAQRNHVASIGAADFHQLAGEYARQFWRDATANMTGINPNTTGSPDGRINGWINPAAFVDVAPFTYGNTGRLVPGLRGPSYGNWDVSILKNIPVRERFKAQFRVELFNAFNMVNFMPPGVTTFGNSGFGAITSTEPARSRSVGLEAAVLIRSERQPALAWGSGRRICPLQAQISSGGNEIRSNGSRDIG